MERSRSNTIYITMLGEFSVSIGNKRISDDRVQSKKPWMMLEYLIANRRRHTPMDELTGLLWSNEKSSNPTGALKTLIFRSRQILEPLEYPTHHIIVQRNNTYEWNNALDTSVDADIFEDLATRVLESNKSFASSEEMLGTCLQAIDLYRGDFLPRFKSESWVVPLATYYHSLFSQVLYKALELLNQKEDYEKIIEICSRCANIDPVDEEIHYNLIYALYHNGNQKKALAHYTNTTEMFYRTFLKSPSERFKDLYKTIQDVESGVILDIGIVRDRLREEGAQGGAYYCEYSVFKDIFQLEMRSTERTGENIYIGMISLSDSKQEMLKSNIMANAMDELGNAIRRSLRRGDVYSRFSICQYLILLPTDSSENANVVLDRILRTFKREYTRKDLNINASIIPINTDGEDISQEELAKEALQNIENFDKR